MSRNISQLFLLCALLICVGCNTTKYIGEEEALVSSNQIKLTSTTYVDNPSSLKEELFTLTKQSPNGKAFGLIKSDWLYEKTKNKPDTAWFPTFIRNRFAEPPSIYDKALSDKTAESMKFYLINRGYRDAEVSHEAVIQNQKAVTTFLVQTKRPYRIRSVDFHSDDARIDGILDSIKGDSKLKVNALVDVNAYEEERQRITSTLLNKGFAKFYFNYIDQLQADSSGYWYDLTLEVLRPGQEAEHEKYTVGEITVYPDFIRETKPSELKTESFKGMTFLRNNSYRIKSKTLENAIVFKEGDLFDKSKVDRTSQKLSGLGVYKFVNINPVEDPTKERTINYDVFLSPSDKLAFGWDADLNYSQIRGNDGQRLFGVSGNVNFSNKNVFGGAEAFFTTVEGGVELNLDPENPLINASNFRWKNDLNIPKFIDTWLMFKNLNRVNALSDRWYDIIKDRANTKISLVYDFVRRTTFYEYNSLLASIGYDLTDNNRRLIFNQINLNYYSPFAEENFLTIIQNNELLQRSFLGDKLFSGFFFSSVYFNKRSLPNRRGNSFEFQGSFELSGHEIAAINGISNLIQSRTDTFSINEIEFSKYLRLDLHQMFFKNFTSKNLLAFRVNVGIASPFGSSTVVPYVKQFYSGGPLSMRAWQIRELGPGADTTSLSISGNQPFYQSGDIRLEFNTEWRHSLFWVFDGALFLDIGNTWSLRPDPNPEDDLVRHFTSDFYKQIAIGTGYGLRMDFGIFLLRLDMGYKIRNPYFDDRRQSYFFHNRIREISLGNINYNLALGYPF